MSRDAGFVLVTSGGHTPGWAAGLRGAVSVASDAKDRVLAEALETAGAAVIDAAVEAPLSLARRIRRLAPHAQVVLVVPAGGAEDLRRAMLFTPGLGEPWIIESGAATQELVERAGAIARQRSAHARQIERVSRRVATLEPDTARTPFLSDRYLATLLELLPEPVLALDEKDDVLFANPVAESLFGLDRDDRAGGLLLPALLGATDPARLRQLLDRGRKGVAHGQLTLRPGDGQQERTYDAALAPVAAERPVRALVLHDVTEQVHTRETLEQQALELEIQADQLQRLLEERDDALAELKEAIRHRNRFYASMSHELRTPINAIIGYNHLLLDGIYGEMPTAQKDALDRTNRAANHLLDLVNDVLDLSKIEAGKLTVEVETVDVPELITDLNATMEPLAQAHDVELRFHLDEACARPVRTDPRRLRQILMNLLSNAVRYGPGAPVDVHCRRTEDGLIVDVEDRGPGIAPEKLEEIFEEFVQLGSPKEGGTGLGLAIARGLAHSLGGELSATSEVGAGSTFTVKVPDLG